MLRNIADRVLRRRDSTLQGAARSDGVAPQRHVLQNNRPMMEALEGRAMLTADVAGVWAGTRMGVNGCIMSLQLVQKGTSVVGIEEIAITSNPQYYAEYNIIGTVSGNKFTFQDQSLISYVDAPGGVWLLPKYSVTVSANGSIITGSWSNSQGKTGTVDLLKVKQPLAPQVTANPVSKKVTAGTTVQFVAAANGVPVPSVQWQRSTNGGKTFSNIAGADALTYSFKATAALNGDEYRAVFSNIVGSTRTTAATLTVT